VQVTLRLYAELNDFVVPASRFATVPCALARATTVKDLVEAHGVPHTEVDLVLVNGEPVGFSHLVADGDRVAVYPVFEGLDIAGVTRVRPEPLRAPRFVVDANLGRLARHLRLAGFDALFDASLGDRRLAEVSAAEGRALLTRDQGLLKRRAVTHGYYVRATAPAHQLPEVVRRFDLARLVRPFTRCTRCNAVLVAASRADVASEVPARSLACFDTFLRCTGCRRVYWRGSHAARLEAILRSAIGRYD
jgi:uncharacterized protein